MKENFDLKKILEELSQIEALKKPFFYTQSEKDKQNHEIFKCLNQKYLLLQKQYANSFEELNANIESRMFKKEFSKGGTTIHRGFYSPSSLDLVIGGCNRGKLINGVPKSNAYDYEYIFDSKGDLICAKKYSDEIDGIFNVISIELFLYKKDMVMSFVFEPYNDYALTLISECQYVNKRLSRYESAICFEGKACVEIDVETFEYTDDLLKSVCWCRYTPSVQLLDENKFVFSRDEEGYLSTYTIEQTVASDYLNFSCVQETYDVKVRRK